MEEHGKRAVLLLADGTQLEGWSFGAQTDGVGEAVFTTDMVGYVETLTDPGYYGQIIVQTFPSLGNYGVMMEDFESSRIWAKGYVVREWCDEPSNFRCEKTLDQLLKEQGIPGIYGVDTRHLTKLLRKGGTLRGIITTRTAPEEREALLRQLSQPEAEDPVAAVTAREIAEYPCGVAGGHKVALLDLGARRSTVKALQAFGCDVTVYPAGTDPQILLASRPDGIFLSEGPGDPAGNPGLVDHVRTLAASGLPLLAVDLGHQLLALAHGAKTEKLPHGHRGGQPVKDLSLGRTIPTHQNHGYVVLGESLPEGVAQVSHRNINDGSCEGIRYRDIPALSVQFLPDGEDNQVGTGYIYKEFTAMMDGRANICR